MTPTLWTAFREFIGLPGKTRVTEIPSEALAMFFLSSPQQIENGRATNTAKTEAKCTCLMTPQR